MGRSLFIEADGVYGYSQKNVLQLQGVATPPKGLPGAQEPLVEMT